MRYVVFSILMITILCGLNLQAAEPFNIRHLVTMKRISEPAVSPDGKTIVFSLRTTDMENDKGRKDLWTIGVDGKNLKQLTTHKSNDFNPIWLNDGKSVLFLSKRAGSYQAWRIPAEGGTAVQVTKLPFNVFNLILAPDGKKIAFTLDVFYDKGIEGTMKEMVVLKDKKTTGLLYDKLLYRHWDTWSDGKRSHIFVMSLDGGKPVDVMKGLDIDSPLKPFGGSEEFSFTPDSNGIIFTAANSGREEAWSTNFDLFHVPIDGSGAAKCLTKKNKAWDTTPSFSPDGKTMAYLSMERPGFEADRFRIMLRSWPEGEEYELTKDWDFSCSSMTWGPKGKFIYIIAQNLGQKSIFVMNVKKGPKSVKTLVNDGSVKALGLAGKQIVYTKDYLKSPVDIYSVDLKGKKTVRLTEINKEALMDVEMGDYEQFTFKGWNDETVYAYAIKPVGFDANKKYPVAFMIHGGPQGSMSNKFHYRWNPQTYAGAGYATIMIDFHGSTGYGQAFTDSISKDWGGKPFIDLQKGLAAALKKYPWMDGEKVGALGASYGGFMINWIAGNWPERFRCLICHDGNLDEQMAYFDTEELWFPEWDHGGTPWDNPEGYQKHNPVNYVKNWKTPMLVIHGGLDYRVVDTQGFSTFTVLQRRGIPSKLLYFPDENHWVLRPHNSILWHDTVIGWLDQWTKKK